VGFKLGSYDPGHTLFIDPTLQWNTFMGSETSNDYSAGIAVDSVGDVLITGWSFATTWGTPQNPYAGGLDAFAAKLSGNDGALQWNTFMGSAGNDSGNGIAVDSTGNVAFITGESDATWGAPKNAYAGDDDTFAAKLSGNDGVLQWNTFMGSAAADDR
jgi:type IV secretory pathway VirB6-like protein